MSDTEQKTPNKTGASGAAWSDAEKIAYLIVLCENEGKAEAKIANAPIPVGRSIVSCKKLLWRLKEKHKDDIEKIKAGQALTTAPDASASGGAAASEKPKTPRKRKSKVDTEGGDADESPKKKATPRKKKGEASPVKQEVIDDKDDLKDDKFEDGVEV
ncbi:hypothetical protein HBH98_148150 [Parastagonospora nodorum]|nr:hypothetical protein HBH52_000460 [Parastagonospora nodorum]KAH4007216.1 hypothetical protein HBI10_011460 [Parastagonospora nodorum]KAH4011564.1 hypothetical protein HBI13_199120 [Parastagonospora nodorum]KAH4034516.1 hypothetical protein HBI09_099870 [Parastagonospora nodorum]KAH4044268.1 hypothetical protein HBH49_222170 [Parastagonospora nodorum]